MNKRNILIAIVISLLGGLIAMLQTQPLLAKKIHSYIETKIGFIAKALPSLPVSDVQFYVVSVLRNIDTVENETIQLYFEVNSNGKIQRIPDTGFITLATLEKKSTRQKLPFDFRIKDASGTVTLLNHQNEIIGKINFYYSQDRLVYTKQSYCKDFTHKFEHLQYLTYPFDQYPTYVPEYSKRFTCIGDGRYNLEVRLGAVIKREGIKFENIF